MRPGPEVRPARPDDLDRVVELCLCARDEASHGSQVCSPDSGALAQQIGALTAAPGGTVLVAEAEGEVVGLLLARLVGPNLFTDEVSLAVEALYVRSGHRRRGVGHALMRGATDLAAEAGAGHVYAAPIPGARGMQRFFVQLGFAPAAHHRVASTSALQRRLSHDVAPVRRQGPRNLEDLIARRRQSRAAVPALLRDPQPAPVGAAEELEDGDPSQAGVRSSISKHVRRAVHTRREPESWTSIS